MNKEAWVVVLAVLCGVNLTFAQIVNVGSGSYTTTFPGTDQAGRNSFPSGTPQLSGLAASKPVPTNDWWSKLVKEDHADNLFNYPMSMRTVDDGLIVSHITPTSTPNGASQPFGTERSIVVGLTGLDVSQVSVSDHTDWTVTMHWDDGGDDFYATSGIGMPFLYFEKSSTQNARIEVNDGIAAIDDERLIITNSASGSNFAVYAPTGSTWQQSGNVYTSDLNGQDYWSMAMLPDDPSSIAAVVDDLQAYAYVFPTNTTTTWDYDPATSIVTTDFLVTTDTKEGSGTSVVMGLLPHQWANLSVASAQPTAYRYTSIRGELQVVAGNRFSVTNSFKGILPTLPYVNNYSEGFDPSQLSAKIAQIENDGLATWTDSYNEGQVMNRLIQTARIADEMGNLEARDKMVNTVRERLEDWLSAEAGEVAFLYYYNDTWSALLGYPSGHGQDNNINDHHFHWGYFIHAAAFLEQYVPGWADEWGDMINLLVRDAASMDRDDDRFPFLRNFSPYAGHSWANGFATFPFGNDQESTSESMQFASSLIHWGSVTGDDDIRDLGVYIYTTEQTATEEYWFDINDRTFLDGYGFKLASRIWGNGYDNQTFWTSDIAAAYGIELYPIHGGSLYLGHYPDYAEALWDEISTNTGILSNEANPNLWHDTYWQYLSFIDPQAAIDLYDSYPDRGLKFGISDAQTYHWLHAMNALGRVNTDITADHPIAASFTRDGKIIYVAQNYSDADIEVRFSDGFVLDVPATELVTSIDVDVAGTLRSDFAYALPGGSVTLSVDVAEGSVTSVEFYHGNVLLGEDADAPYTWRATDLGPGMQDFYARVYVDQAFNNTNVVTVQVGDQKPYNSLFVIPGVVTAGDYDVFEGGVGQNVTYFDSNQENNGNYREDEFVDAALDPQEGPTIGWLEAGEWLEYSIDVQVSGFYDVTCRIASANANGGGPFYFEMDGVGISSTTAVPSTSGWNTWEDLVVEQVPLTEGQHILRLVMTGGEFNMAAMRFDYDSPLDYTPPVADAGIDIVVMIPVDSIELDGSASRHPTGEPITYLWEQVLGPSVLVFDDAAQIVPTVSNIQEGVYRCRLTVSDGTYTSSDEVLLIASVDGNLPPAVEITSPSMDESFKEGETINITASASDVDGAIATVDFYLNGTIISQALSGPYTATWADAVIGRHTLQAVATDNSGAVDSSQIVEIEVADVLSCSDQSDEAQQGAFSAGYAATFETVGNAVTITFTLLDTDKDGVVAFLWQESPFTEYEMTRVSGQTFSTTFGGQTLGDEISFACKFAFAGGLAVTKYIRYTVGEDCMLASVDDSSIDKITVYPNPVSDILYINGLQQATPVRIFTVDGRLVKSLQVTHVLDVRDLPVGQYMLQLGSGNRRVMRQFIKG